MAIKYQLPPFLEGELTRQAYVRWLHRKAQAHARRDRKRSGPRWGQHTPGRAPLGSIR